MSDNALNGQEQALGKRIIGALEKGNDLQEYDTVVRRLANRTLVNRRSVELLTSEVKTLAGAGVRLMFAVNRANDLAEYDTLRSSRRKTKPQRARFEELRARLWPTEEVEAEQPEEQRAWQTVAPVRRTVG